MLWSTAAPAQEPKPLRERRGAYLSGAVGAGYFFAEEDYTRLDGTAQGTETWRGGVVRTRMQFGGTIARGVIVGIEFGGVIGAGRYTDDAQLQATSFEDDGALIGPVVQLFVQPMLPGDLFVRVGVGGTYVQHLSAGAGSSGAGGSAAIGWLKPLAPGFNLGASIVLDGYISDDADDVFERDGSGFIPSVNLEAVAF
ncbi:MAG: hypothetical protein AAFV53_00130 [Myxococcota bacterium]